MLSDGHKVFDIMEDFNKSMEEVRDMGEVLGKVGMTEISSVSRKKKLRNKFEWQKSLEEEYNRLMAKEVEDLLSVAVPSHALPDAMAAEHLLESE